MTLFFASVLIALIISALCSLTEAALLSLNPSQLADLELNKPRTGKIWRNFKDNVERPIAFILILNTAGHTIGASVAGAQFDKIWGDQYIWVFSIAFTFAMLQFTEILPKSLGVRYNKRLAPVIAGPLSALVRVSMPLITFVHWINRPFRIGQNGQSQESRIEEIQALATMAKVSDEISALQKDVIHGASTIAQRTIGELMLPAEQMSTLDAEAPLHPSLETALADSHTRFPVRRGEGGEIIGYANVKDIVAIDRKQPDAENIQGAIRPIHRVQAGDSVASSMRDFIQRHVHIAIVEDEQGDAVGLITLEDLLEELVGDVEDEYDRLPRDLRQLGEQRWAVGGGRPVGDINEALGAELDGPEQTSLASWFEQRAGEPVEPGQELEEGSWTVRVRRVRRGRLFDARIVRRGEQD